MTKLPGATPDGTQSYFQQHPLNCAPSTLGKTNWKVSPVGFGGYRIDSDVDTHSEALKLALTSGCNLIDTSTNYTDGHSEKLIGNVLKLLFDQSQLKREQVVVVSKVGYVQGENLTLAQQREARKLGFAEMVKYSDECWHCISPDFLKDQIGRSLARLQLKQLDAVLLHNPEYFLKTDSNHEEYYRRIKSAFQYLETEVASGRIQYYGISSNTFPEDLDRSDFTSLQVILDIAKEIGAEHFALIQFPFNLYEPDAALNPNNVTHEHESLTVLQLAKKANLGTLINRPLNAFYSQKLIRLADAPSHADKDVEETLKESFLIALQTESDYSAKDLIPAKQVAWAHILQQNFEKIHDLEGWKNILAYQIEPAIEDAQQVLMQHPQHKEWLDAYLTDSQQLFTDITHYLEEITANLSRKISKLLDQSAPALKNSASLSQKSIRVYRSLEGVDCILVGARKSEYVNDVLKLAPTLSHAEAIKVLQAIQQDLDEGEKAES